MFLIPKNRLQRVYKLFSVAKCHLWPLLCHSPGMACGWRNSKQQSNSMIGIDSYLFCAEKSIASDFKQLKSLLVLLQSLLCHSSGTQTQKSGIIGCVPRTRRPRIPSDLHYMARHICRHAISSKSNIYFYHVWHRFLLPQESKSKRTERW